MLTAASCTSTSPCAVTSTFSSSATTYGRREVWLAYGAIAIDPRGTGDSVARTGMGRTETHLTISPPIPDWGHWIDYRIEVREGNLSAFANGQKFHTERLSEHVDPWLVLGAGHPHYEGAVRDLRIGGNPTVPDVLQLSEGPDLFAWRADYYNEPVDAENALWQKRGDEIVGNRFKDAPGSTRESILQYHRPILEDGQIDYEFYYSAGKTEVHPAIDRLAFLLEPDGVKLHVLSDAQFSAMDLHRTTSGRCRQAPRSRSNCRSRPMVGTKCAWRLRAMWSR